MDVAQLMVSVDVRGVGRANSALRSVESTGRGAARTLMATLGVTGVGAALLKTGQMAAGFEAQMSEVKAVSGATAKQMAKLRQASLDLGAASGIGARQTAKAAAELVKGGVSIEKVLKGGLKGALDLAQAGSMDVAEAAETVANALNLFKMGGEKATHVADALATAANATTLDVQDFAQALAQGGGAAKAAGLSFDQTITAFEAMAKSGMKSGSDIGTSFKTAMLQVVQNTTQGKGATKALAQAFFDAKGNMKPLADVAGILRDKLSGLTREQRLQQLQQLAGTDGFRALLALYDQGASGIDKLERGLGKQGTAAEVARVKNDNLAGAVKRAKAAFESLVDDKSSAPLGFLKDGVDEVAQALDALRTDGVQGALVSLGMSPEDADAVVAALGDVGDAASDAARSVGDMWNTMTGHADAADTFHALATSIRGVATACNLAFDAGHALGTALVAALSFTASNIATVTAPIAQAFGALFDAIGDGLGAISKIDPTGAFKYLADGLHDASGKAHALQRDLEAIAGGKISNKVFKLQVNASEALAEIAKVRGQKIANKVAKILGSKEDAERKIQEIRNLGIPVKTARVLTAGVAAAKGDFAEVKAAVTGVPSDVRIAVTVDGIQQAIASINAVLAAAQAARNTSVTPRGGGGPKKISANAHGRGPIGDQLSVVGEAGYPEWVGNQFDGWDLVNGPRIMALDARDSVIPTDPALSARAAMLAMGAGVPGYAKGSGKVTQYQTAVNPFTKKRERHTPAEWEKIRKRWEASRPTVASITGREPAPTESFGLPSDPAHGIGVSEIAYQNAGQQKPAPPTAAMFAQAAVGLASLTKGDLGDDVTAAQGLVKAFTDDLEAAKKTGDPTKIAEAAQNLRAASDQLDQASQAITDQLIGKLGADALFAKINTPDDVSDDIQALTSELGEARKAYDAARTSGDVEAQSKYGELVLSLTGEIKQLKDATEQLTETQQQMLDLTRQALDDANKALAGAHAINRAMGQYMVGLVQQTVGQRSGRRSNTPRPMSMAGY